MAGPAASCFCEASMDSESMCSVAAGEQQYPRYRWVILSVLFAATTVNYLDRTALSILVDYVKGDLALTDRQYGYVVAAIRTGYAVGLLIAGRIIDWLGVKVGYLVFICLWTAAACLTGLSGSWKSLCVFQLALGLTAAGNFPSAIKAVTEWFPAKQRSLATSLFNSGPSIAMVVGPVIILWVMMQLEGWRWTFAVVASLGVPLILLWPFVYRKPEHCEASGFQRNPQGAAQKLRWRRLLLYRETYGIMIGKFCTDPVWWFYIAWLPNYLYSTRNFNIKDIAWALPVVYGIAIVLGNIAGWAAGYLIQRGWSERSARKAVMCVCAMCMPLSAMAVFAQRPLTAILLVSLACSAHNGWSANIFTLAGDCFKPKAVGSVTGLIGFAGGVGGILISGLVSGYIIDKFGYVPIFILMGVLHPVAFVFVHAFVGKGEPIDVHA